MKGINMYPDGTSYAKLDNEYMINNSLLIRVNSYDELWKMGQIVDAYHNETGKEPRVVIPNLIDAQADARFATNESFGLAQVVKFMASLPAKFEFFHVHNPEAVQLAFEVLGKKIVIRDNRHFVKCVIDLLGLQNTVIDGVRADIGNTVLMSADAGGYKPLVKLADAIKWKGETYSAGKSRRYDRNSKTSLLTQVIDREDFGGKDILIVDDICVYGGTFKGLATLLRTKNVGKIYLVVSHMTVQNLRGKDPVTNYFDGIYTTNSKFNKYYIEDKNGEPLEAPNIHIVKQYKYLEV